MTLDFAKYHGIGNDFILLDHLKGGPSLDSALARQLCHRNFGIGADGVIALESVEGADAKIRILNANGSDASMCGNGLRCAAHFLSALTQKFALAIQSPTRVHHCRINASCVSATLGPPKAPPIEKTVKTATQSLVCYFVDTGVPHLVVFVEDLDRKDWIETARALRFAPEFAKEGVNVNFAKQVSEQAWRVRTYERGVEAETLACGTGAAAVCAVAWQKRPRSTPYTIHCSSQEKLEFDLFTANSLLKEITMTGRVTFVFRGTFSKLCVA